MLNSSILKKSVAGIVVAGFAATLATGVMADRGGKHGKRGGIAKMCSGEFAERMQERDAAVQAALNLSPEQQALFSAMQAQRTAAQANMQPICAKVTEGEKPSREVRKKIRSMMKEAKRDGKDTRKAFRNSLTDDQKAAMKKLRKNKRKSRRDKKRNDG